MDMRNVGTDGVSVVSIHPLKTQVRPVSDSVAEVVQKLAELCDAENRDGCVAIIQTNHDFAMVQLDRVMSESFNVLMLVPAADAQECWGLSYGTCEVGYNTQYPQDGLELKANIVN